MSVHRILIKGIGTVVLSLGLSVFSASAQNPTGPLKVPSMAVLSGYPALVMKQYGTVYLQGYYPGSVTGAGSYTFQDNYSGTPNGGNIIAPSDHPGTCSSGCMVSDLSYVTPEQFGAKWVEQSGAFDDTSAIQNAINAVQAASGGTVQFSCHQYDITNVTVTGSNIVLNGQGDCSYLHKTDLVRTNGINVTGDSGTHTTGNVVSNLRVDSTYDHGQTSSNTGGGVEGQYTDNFVISNVFSQYWADEGFGCILCNDWSVINNSRTDTVGQGISSFSGLRPIISNTHHTNTRLFYPIDIEGGVTWGEGAGATVVGNTASGGFCTGIALTRYPNSTVVGNTVTGIVSSNCGGTAPGIGITVTGSPHSTIVGNTSYSNQDYGIKLGAADDYSVVSGNTTYNNGTGSLLIDQETSRGIQLLSVLMVLLKVILRLLYLPV